MVSTVVLVFTLVGIAFSMGRRITEMERKVNIMFTWFLRHDTARTLASDEIRKFYGEGAE